MTNRAERGSEVSERMRERLDSEPSDNSDTSEASEPSERDRKVRNVKKEWNGRYVYLPDGIDDRIEDEYARLAYECGRDIDWKPDLNRHFYPVLLSRGIDAVEEMGPEGFREQLDELDLV